MHAIFRRKNSKNYPEDGQVNPHISLTPFDTPNFKIIHHVYQWKPSVPPQRKSWLGIVLLLHCISGPYVFIL